MLACGPTGRGAVEHFGVNKRVRMLYGTFSKAFGALGGFVAGSKEMLDYLRFYAHSYVYSCALPPVVVAAILKALELGKSRPELRQRLWDNARYFHKQLNALGIDTGNSNTYIMPIVIGDRERMHRLGHQLRQRGLWVAPVDYPAPTGRTASEPASPEPHPRGSDEAPTFFRHAVSRNYPSWNTRIDAAAGLSLVTPMAQRYVSNKNESVRMFESRGLEFCHMSIRPHHW